MSKRSFADLMIGVLAIVSLTGLAAVVSESVPQRTPAADERWSLPVKRRRRRVREDACRHCNGNGRCEACLPAPCRMCRGTGLQPRDAALVARLTALWKD